jgi:Ca2+-binding EF-hand superfamily protein
MRNRLTNVFLATSLAILGLTSQFANAQTPSAAAQAASSPAPQGGDDDADAPDQKAALDAYLQNGFDAVDANHDGKIDRDEWAAFQRRTLAARKARFDQWFAKADSNGDGFIQRAEARAHEPLLYAHFHEIDANGDGKISPAELRLAIRRHMREQQAGDGASAADSAKP